MVVMQIQTVTWKGISVEVKMAIKIFTVMVGTKILLALVEMVAMTTATMEEITNKGESNLLTSSTGSQIASPKIMMVALVTATPRKANNVMVLGRPDNWPTTWARWLLA